MRYALNSLLMVSTLKTIRQRFTRCDSDMKKEGREREREDMRQKLQFKSRYDLLRTHTSSTSNSFSAVIFVARVSVGTNNVKMECGLTHIIKASTAQTIAKWYVNMWPLEHSEHSLCAHLSLRLMVLMRLVQIFLHYHYCHWNKIRAHKVHTSNSSTIV